jgi:hypothetical protein
MKKLLRRIAIFAGVSSAATRFENSLRVQSEPRQTQSQIEGWREPLAGEGACAGDPPSTRPQPELLPAWPQWRLTCPRKGTHPMPYVTHIGLGFGEQSFSQHLG